MTVWLTVDGQRQGPHQLTQVDGAWILTPMDEEWLALTPIEELTRMGIVEMRLQ